MGITAGNELCEILNITKPRRLNASSSRLPSGFFVSLPSKPFICLAGENVSWLKAMHAAFTTLDESCIHLLPIT